MRVRRHRALAPTLTDDEDPDGWLIHRGLRVSPATRIVEIDGAEIDLTRREFELLQALLESRPASSRPSVASATA